MKLLTIENNELRLCTNLDEYAFGKTNYNSLLDEQGIIFDGKNFLQWAFDEIKSFAAEKNGKSENLVFYCGKNPLSQNARTLNELLSEGGKSAFAAAFAVCRALTFAAKQNYSLPLVGAGGILVELNDAEKPETAKILFAPQKLFSNSASSLCNKDKLTLETGWLNETLSELPAICFERAVIVYKLLSGHLPFENENQTERNADILDKKFLPLELCVNQIDKTLACEVNNALKLNSSAVNLPGKKQKGKSSEDLKPNAEFPLEKFQAAFELASKNQTSNKDFEEKAATYIKNLDSKINAKRKLRRNSTTISIICAIIITIAAVTANTIKSRQTDYTSIGLTSTQTIQAYMNAANQKDTMILSDFGSGKSVGLFSDMVSRMYIMNKQRLAYSSADNGFANPASWLLFITDEKKYERSGVFGITNLKIDEKPESFEVELKKRNENPLPLTSENGKTLENGQNITHAIEYFIIYPDGEVADYIVEKANGTISLTYKKNRWVITDLNVQNTQINVDCAKFKSDYFEALNKTEGNAIAAAELLRETYFWLPDNETLQKEKEQIDYQLANPYEALGF